MRLERGQEPWKGRTQGPRAANRHEFGLIQLTSRNPIGRQGAVSLDERLISVSLARMPAIEISSCLPGELEVTNDAKHNLDLRRLT